MRFCFFHYRLLAARALINRGMDADEAKEFTKALDMSFDEVRNQPLHRIKLSISNDADELLRMNPEYFKNADKTG